MTGVTYTLDLCFLTLVLVEQIDYNIKGSKGFIVVRREICMLLFMKREKPGKGCHLLLRTQNALFNISSKGSFQKGQLRHREAKNLGYHDFISVLCKLLWVMLCCKEQVSASDLRCPKLSFSCKGRPFS